MRYLTARKRAEGKGASGTGTEHHWYMTMSAVGLAFLVPVFVYIFGKTLGQGHEAVIETFSRPFPAILTALTVVVGMRHFAKGAQMMIEDYARGTSRKIGIIIAYSISYAVTAVALYALAKMTFIGFILGAMGA
ncbi:succinate dehydrogenase, hydrophobic membrane anchor protein [Pseudothioclava nitratireducens]|jgi:succinate dehydrogenase / fumarate reductase membrane anchor subunit|uniref:succinate dehydrogenase, hydrophobic membrane anchor protein n=1 Tax=Pseudothioclava nitratireducens TaxID=1928646 RepID=UPI0023D98BFD|nr:succinate dehydrogenase, hydrophobic membrane anchor protein [Defluviimonas nitratireducens]MDF1619168.1 succinate dehydrogenase, hydrophobic membrane anchor protein [Defluviimonas nitratireducens]